LLATTFCGNFDILPQGQARHWRIIAGDDGRRLLKMKNQRIKNTKPVDGVHVYGANFCENLITPA